jgi:hypothetical protein
VAFKVKQVDHHIGQFRILDLCSERVEDGVSGDAGEQSKDHSLHLLDIFHHLEIGLSKIGDVLLWSL